jgi:hypothetical protein
LSLFLIFLFFIIKNFSKNIKKLLNYKIIIIIMYVSILSFLLTNTTSNLGISSRQKFMLLPFIYFILAYFLQTRKIRH